MQQTEQIQESEFISLNDFITNWTEVVEEMDRFGIHDRRSDVAKQKGLDYGNNKFCLVGEAHHNNNDYCSDEHFLCSACEGMSIYEAFDALIYGGEVFKEFKETLYNHMIQEHPEKMRR